MPLKPEVDTTSRNFILKFIVMGLWGIIRITIFTYACQHKSALHYLGKRQPQTNSTKNQLGYANLNNRIGTINAIKKMNLMPGIIIAYKKILINKYLFKLIVFKLIILIFKTFFLI